MRFDTLIVGASFSGLSAAMRASDAGSVGIIDKRVKPGSPVNTTGAIPIEWLERMNTIPPADCIASAMRGMELVAPNGESIKFMKDKADGYVMYPDRYTRWLVEAVLAKGCKLFSNTTASALIRDEGDSRRISGVRTTQGEFRADYIIGADGHGSNVGKWLGLTKPLAPEDCHIGLEYLVENVGQDPHLFKLWFGHDIAPGGYAWSFPEGEGHLKLGVGVPIAAGGNAKKYLEYFRSRNKELSGKVLRREGGAIPTARPLKTAVSGNVMVVGDAGRFCSPLHGGGIWFGMLSGKLAGDAIVAGDPALYDKRWKHDLGGLLNRHYKLKNWFYGLSDRDINRLVKLFDTYQTDMASPDKEFSAALLHALKSDPVFVMKAATGWTKAGLLADALHRIVRPNFRIA